MPQSLRVSLPSWSLLETSFPYGVRLHWNELLLAHHCRFHMARERKATYSTWISCSTSTWYDLEGIGSFIADISLCWVTSYRCNISLGVSLARYGSSYRSRYFVDWRWGMRGFRDQSNPHLHHKYPIRLPFWAFSFTRSPIPSLSRYACIGVVFTTLTSGLGGRQLIELTVSAYRAYNSYV